VQQCQGYELLIMRRTTPGCDPNDLEHGRKLDGNGKWIVAVSPSKQLYTEQDNRSVGAEEAKAFAFLPTRRENHADGQRRNKRPGSKLAEFPSCNEREHAQGNEGIEQNPVN
jgi:hypothetical protein